MSTIFYLRSTFGAKIDFLSRMQPNQAATNQITRYVVAILLSTVLTLMFTCVLLLFCRSSKSQQSSIIHRLFGSNVQLLSRCRCGKESKRDSTTLLFNLEYPEVSDGKKILGRS